MWDDKKSQTKVSNIETQKPVEKFDPESIIDAKLFEMKSENTTNINKTKTIPKDIVSEISKDEVAKKEIDQMHADLLLPKNTKESKVVTHNNSTSEKANIPNTESVKPNSSEEKNKPNDPNDPQSVGWFLDTTTKRIWDNKLLTAAGAAIASWWIWKLFKSKENKKEWEEEKWFWWSVKSKITTWLLWVWAGVWLYYGWSWLWEKYWEDKVRKMAIAKVIESAPDSTKDFLKQVCEDHAEELKKCGIMDIPKKIMEFAAADAAKIPWQKAEEVKNKTIDYIKWILPTRATDFLGKNKEEAEELTKEQIDQNHEEVNKETERLETIYIWEAEEKEVSKENMQEQWTKISNDRKSQSKLDRNINKSKIINTYSNAVSIIQIAWDSKNEKWNLLYPNITNGMVAQFLEMIKFMKSQNEYMAMAEGMRVVMNINNQNIPLVPTEESVLNKLNNKDNIQKWIENCKTDEEVTKYIAWLYKSKDSKEKYDQEIQNWVEVIWVNIKNIQDGNDNLINQKNISDLKNIWADMYGHGFFSINDQWLDKYWSTIASISGAFIAMWWAATATWVWAVPWVPAMIIWAALWWLATWWLNSAMWQEYSGREAAWDFVLNMIPGWVLTKLWKNTAKFIWLTGRIAKAAEISIVWLWWASAGILSSGIKTWEWQVWSNVWIWLALAAIPYGLGKIWKWLWGIKLPSSITNLSNSILNKYQSSSNALFLNLRKAQTIMALRWNKELSETTKNILIKDASTLSKEMQQDIGKYIYDLEKKWLLKEAQEIKDFLSQYWIKEIKFNKALSKATQSSKEALLPSIKNLSNNIKKWTQAEIDSFNDFSKKSWETITYQGKKYRIAIDGNRDIVFFDDKLWSAAITPLGKNYDKIVSFANTYITGKVSNSFIKRTQKELIKNWSAQTVKDLLEKNWYQITPKIKLRLEKNKQATVNSLLAKYNLDFKNCISTGDYSTRIGKIIRATTKASVTSLPMWMALWYIFSEDAKDATQNIWTNIWATILWWWKLRLVANIIDMIDPIDYVREKVWI